MTGKAGWAGWAIAGVAGAAVIAGLATAGGPMQARKERRDEARMDDLRRLAVHIGCLSDEGGQAQVPSDLSPTPGCPGPVPLTDSRTGEAYRIAPLQAGKYRLCAGFELPPPPQSLWDGVRRDGDCIVQELPRPVPQVPAPLRPAEPDPMR